VKRKGYTPNIGGGGVDRQLLKAIALSKGQKYSEYVSSGEDSDWNNDHKQPLKPFGGVGVTFGGSCDVAYDKFEIDPNDFELITCLKVAIVEKLSESVKGGVAVSFRFPNGKKETHRFKTSESVSALYDFVWIRQSPHLKFYLVDFGSKQKLLDLEAPLMVIEDDDHSAIVTVCSL
jgi:hypothetical protein